MRIYEIDPEVSRLAQTHFTFLAQARASVDLVMGDARLSMEREAPQEFDLLLLDAFNSDAIPVHLLTKEAFETYLRHLRPDGVLGVHISNRHLDLDPVVRRLAEHFGLKHIHIEDDDDNYRAVFSSDWILMTANAQFLEQEAISRAGVVPDADERVDLWTDDYANLLGIVRW